MTDVEELLRGALTDHAADAPEPHRLASRVRRRQRRTTIVAITAVVVLVGGIAGGLAAIVGQPVSQPSIVGGVGDAVRTVSYHGITLMVPSSWSVNDPCALSDTVHVVDTQPVIDCAFGMALRQPGSEVFLERNPVDEPLSDSRHATLDGVEEVIGSRNYGSLPATQVIIPALSIRIVVLSPTSETSQQIVESIRLASASPEGCVMHEPTVGTPSYVGLPAASDPLTWLFVPPHPVSGTDCQYLDGWLTGSTELNRAALGRATRSLTPASNGLSLRSCRSPLATAGSGFVLHLHYVDAPLTNVTIGKYCGDVVAYNGEWVSRITPSALRYMTGPLHSWFDAP